MFVTQLKNCSPLLINCRYFSRISIKLNNDNLIAVNESKANHYVKKKINEIVRWYEELTGMDEVREMQNRVITVQNRFAEAQEKRREANKALNKIQAKLKEISSELDATTRGESRYLQLVTQEHEILKEERRLNNEFSLLEREERESFTLLSSYVKESHQKERAQAERTKYWSIIGSVVGTIIGVAGSSINNEFKMRELRKLVKETSLKTASLTQLPSSETLYQHEKQLSDIITEMKNIVNSYSDEGKGENELAIRLDKMLVKLNNEKENNVDQHVVRLEERVKELKEMLCSVQNYDGHLVALPMDFEELINKQRTETRIVLLAVAAFSMLAPIIISWIQR